jgi:outer membrane protein OmpA-like peptidoglycan-associated protein
MLNRRALPLGLIALSALVGACAERAALTALPVHVVFFEGESAALEGAALGVLRDAADVANRYPTQPVRVLGFADPEGSSAANRALSNARAQAVSATLQRYGVAEGRIRVSARGEVPFELTATESRRVEVRIGPQ